MVLATDYPVVAESNNHGSSNNSKGTSSEKGSWSQVVRCGDVPKPHLSGDVRKPHLTPPNHELSGKPAAKPSDGSSIMGAEAENTATVMGAEARKGSKSLDPPSHAQTAESIAVKQASRTLYSGAGNNTQNPTGSSNRKKSGGRRAAAANGKPQAVPTPSFYPVAAVPPPLLVHDYIMPNGPNHLIPEGYLYPTFKGIWI